MRIYPNTRLEGQIDLIVEKEVNNSLHYSIKEKFEKLLMFESIRPQIKFIGDGTIVPNAEKLEVPFEAVNLKAVEVKVARIFEKNIPQFLQVNSIGEKNEIKRVGRLIFRKNIPLDGNKSLDLKSWNSFTLNLASLIKPEPGALYRVYLSCRKDQSLYKCPAAEEEDNLEEERSATNSFSENDKDLFSYEGFDEPYYSGNFVWREKDNPCTDSYFLWTERKVSRNFLASDLGIIAKAGNDGELKVIVTSIQTTMPVSNVTLEFFNFQQKKIGSALTNGEGMASVKLEAQPFLVLAKKGDQRGYLKVDDGSSLSLSMFDVSGTKTNKGIKGFIYGERGVWRPGDSLYLGFILEDKLKMLPVDHPVVMEIFNPKGQLTNRIIKTMHTGGFYDFRTAIKHDAPTGNWQAKVIVGGTSFSKSLKIETIKPNRLKMNLAFNKEILSANEKKHTAILKVNWLHGAPGRNLRAKVDMNLLSGKTSFNNYEDYVFDDPSRYITGDEVTVFDGKVNNEGEIEITPEMNVGSRAPGMLEAHFNIKAFEEGGDFSIGYEKVNYSPYLAYVGLKIPEGTGWRGALQSNKKHLLPVVVVNEKGRPVQRNKVKVELYKVRWRWWWENVETNNLASYVGNTSEYLLKSSYLDLKNGKGLYELDLKDKYWGRLFVRVVDEESGHSTGKLIYMDYDYWNEGGGEADLSGATMLQVSLSKEEYLIGEKAELKFPFAKGGRALVSIENGSRILDAYWVLPEDGERGVKIEIKDYMSPNIYVHVTLIQPHEGSGNDLPIRMYGVASAKVTDQEKLLEPQIEMPGSLRPNDQYVVEVKEKEGKAMVYTLAIVDEGLLDITNFKTPDPKNYFNAKEALGVKTWDLFNDVLGAYSGKMTGLLAVGGDEYLKNKGKKQVNRFKPVVQYVGPFELEKGKKNKHTLTMTNYVGSVKAMVVAGKEGAYGNVSLTTPVKQPLMVIGTLPRVLGPQEKVKLPVTLFVMEKGINAVNLSVETNNLLQVNGEKSRQLNIRSTGDTTVYFDLTVNQILGKGEIEILANGNNEKANYKVEIEVRPSNPEITEIISGVVDEGSVWETQFKPIGIKGTNRVSLEVSGMPSINLERRLSYLIQYPHGCVEQTTSAAFPQLFLSEFVKLEADKLQQVKENIRQGINKLSHFQLANGGLSFWPGFYDDANEWGTSYAGHFLIEAEKKGFTLPHGFLDKWLSYQQEKARGWSFNNRSYNQNELNQAYRLFTLALAGYPALSAMNRLRETNGISQIAKWRLAAAYYLAGEQAVAKKMVSDLTTKVAPYREPGYTYGSSWRDQAMILETLILLEDKERAREVAVELATALGNDSWYTTQTVAYGLLALAKLYKGQDMENELSFEVNFADNQKETVRSHEPVVIKNLELKDLNESEIKIINKGKRTLFTRLVMQGIPLMDKMNEQSNNLLVNSIYKLMDGTPINPFNIAQGTSFMAEIKVSHPGVRTNYENMALTQIFPSGWEIRNIRLEESASLDVGDNPTYRDYRDDRVLTYFDLPKGKTKTFRVFLNATYQGKYYLPAVFCEAMYDNQIAATKKGGWVSIIQAGRKDGD